MSQFKNDMKTHTDELRKSIKEDLGNELNQRDIKLRESLDKYSTEVQDQFNEVKKEANKQRLLLDSANDKIYMLESSIRDHTVQE